jgi:hypothetical protein
MTTHTAGSPLGALLSAVPVTVVKLVRTPVTSTATAVLVHLVFFEAGIVLLGGFPRVTQVG